ncbi:hypothetical protein [Parahaliea aestuarii]|uniref:Uncharacterized protein n=1 Tax=Parahaliea aestuarii TaxID=1852021 RepID=A0A5C8ZQH3_9GAMM|nr:hypothetical protein [Parahaliea aestuarii]TXS89581.1 hypothetical protein FVW59_16305 [Parahaliea aestuarii]
MPSKKALNSARAKLNEARFFLALMDRVETERTPITNGQTFEQEYTYYLSACLNGCYSAVVCLEDGGKLLKGAARAFKNERPEFYLREFGLRSRSVHYGPVRPGTPRYIPPQPGAVNFNFSVPQASAPQQQGRADFSLYGTFYFDDEKDFDRTATVRDICSRHIGEIAAFIDQCEKDASEPPQPASN